LVPSHSFKFGHSDHLYGRQTQLEQGRFSCRTIGNGTPHDDTVVDEQQAMMINDQSVNKKSHWIVVDSELR
jgi:hypothetical protein